MSHSFTKNIDSWHFIEQWLNAGHLSVQWDSGWVSHLLNQAHVSEVGLFLVQGIQNTVMSSYGFKAQIGLIFCFYFPVVSGLELLPLGNKAIFKRETMFGQAHDLFVFLKFAKLLVKISFGHKSIYVGSRLINCPNIRFLWLIWYAHVRRAWENEVVWYHGASAKQQRGCK